VIAAFLSLPRLASFLELQVAKTSRNAALWCATVTRAAAVIPPFANSTTAAGRRKRRPFRRRTPRNPRDRAPGSRAHSSLVVSPAPSSAMWIASRLANSVALAFSLTRCSLPGGSKKLSPAWYTLAEPVAEFCERNSLLTGNLQGIFTNIGSFGEKMPARTQQNQLVAGQFPAK
jgi:hypothetical protein